MTTVKRFLFRALAGLMVAVPAQAGERIVVLDAIAYPGQSLDGIGATEILLKRPLAGQTVVATGAADLAGKVAARTILPKRPIPLSFLRAPLLVETGKPVRVIYRDGAIAIEMTGRALGPGSVGDTVRVRNTRSGATITGVVSGVAEVAVVRQ